MVIKTQQQKNGWPVLEQPIRQYLPGGLELVRLMKANTSLTGTDIRTWNLHNYCRTKILMGRKSNTGTLIARKGHGTRGDRVPSDRVPWRQTSKATKCQGDREANNKKTQCPQDNKGLFPMQKLFIVVKVLMFKSDF